MSGDNFIWNAHFKNITSRGASFGDYAFLINNPNVYGVFISGGEIFGYKKDGISILQGSDIKIDNLNIYGNNQSGGGYGGIFINDEIGNLSLTNLNIGSEGDGTQRYGIKIGTGCYNYSLNGNVYGEHNVVAVDDSSKANHGPFGDSNLSWDRSKLNAVNSQSLQLHAFTSTADSGAYFGSMLPAQAIVSGGANFQNGQWTAKANEASIMSFGADGINLFTDYALPTGNTFSPSRRLSIFDNGATIYKRTGSIAPPPGGVLLSGDNISGSGTTGLVITTEDNKTFKFGASGITFADNTSQITAAIPETPASILAKIKVNTTSAELAVTRSSDETDTVPKLRLYAADGTTPLWSLYANGGGLFSGRVDIQSSIYPQLHFSTGSDNGAYLGTVNASHTIISSGAAYSSTGWLAKNGTNGLGAAGIIDINPATATEGIRFYLNSTGLNFGQTFTPKQVAQLDSNGNLKLNVVGGKFFIAEGANGCAGKSILAAGSVIVPTNCITPNSRVMLTLQSCQRCGTLYLGTMIAGTSFQIKSTNNSDTSIAFWMIIDPS